MDYSRTTQRLIVACLLTTTTHVWAQAPTFQEWWAQKKTQKKYHSEQIAAFKAHLDNVRKGVDIVYRGWTTIENIKDGNFNLHRDFFGSFKKVNPRVANMAKVADIAAFEILILRDMKKVRDFCLHNDEFTPEEVRYVAEVYTNMIFLCDASVSELLTILRHNDAAMSDEERITRIDALYEGMQEKRTFARVFAYESRRLSNERTRARYDVEHMKIITR